MKHKTDFSDRIIKAKQQFATACRNYINSPEYKNMMAAFKRLGAISPQLKKP